MAKYCNINNRKRKKPTCARTARQHSAAVICHEILSLPIFLSKIFTVTFWPAACSCYALCMCDIKIFRMNPELFGDQL